MKPKFILIILILLSLGYILCVSGCEKQGQVVSDMVYDYYEYHRLKVLEGWSPKNDATDIPIQSEINISFNKPVSYEMVANHFRVTDGEGNQVPGNIELQTHSFIFTPDQPFQYQTTYTMTVDGTMQAMDGNPMNLVIDTLIEEHFFESKFTTEIYEPPFIIQNVFPKRKAIGVSPNTYIAFTFSEEIEVDPFESALTVQVNSERVKGQLIKEGENQLYFYPDTPFPLSSLCDVFISTEASSKQGKKLSQEFFSYFVIADSIKASTPTVINTIPSPDEQDVSARTFVSLEFSEGMNPQKVSDYFVLQTNLEKDVIPGTLVWDGFICTYFPSETLGYGVEYEIILQEEAQDLDGEPLAQDFVLYFTTREEPDLTPPEILETLPPIHTENFPINSIISLQFSEIMNLSETRAAFGLFKGNASQIGAEPVLGTLSWVGNTLIFKAESLLELSEEYTLQVTQEASDVSGNALSENFLLSFTTSATYDTSPPVIVTAPQIEEVGCGKGQAEINWSVDESASHQIAYSLSPGVDFETDTLIPSVMGAATGKTASFFLTGLTTDTTYYFKSKSIDEGGNVWRGEEIQISLKATSQAPSFIALPTDVLHIDEVSFTWDGNTDQYAIQKDTNPAEQDVDWGESFTVTAEDYEAWITTPGYYRFRLRAYNSSTTCYSDWVFTNEFRVIKAFTLGEDTLGNADVLLAP